MKEVNRLHGIIKGVKEGYVTFRVYNGFVEFYETKVDKEGKKTEGKFIVKLVVAKWNQ